MPVFPPGAPVTVLVDGRRLPAYVRAYVLHGRVFAPVNPLLRMLSDRMWLEDGRLVVERDGRRASVPLALHFDSELDVAYVAVGPLLRALGDGVRFQQSGARLDVRTAAPAAIASPTPFVPPALTPPPRIVFTPDPIPTPRPVWTGPPVPRRTPLPGPPRRRGRATARG